MSDTDRLWWGYLHTNGSLQVKPYYDEGDLEAARTSPFVTSVHGPWLVEDRQGALEALRSELATGAET